MISNRKFSFFPPLMIAPEYPRGSLKGPEAKIRGKSSQTVIRNQMSLSEIFSSVIRTKNFLLDSPAIFHECKSKITFRMLDDISTRLAQNLAKILHDIPGLHPNGDGDTVVAILLNENVELDERFITLILGILKLGITYTVLDPSVHHPEDLEWAIKLISPVLLITESCTNDPEIKNLLMKLEDSSNIFSTKMNVLWSNSKVDSIVLDKRIPTLDISDPEYWSELPLIQRTVGIFFTAGSVGSQHGVRITTREVYNRIHWQNKVFPIGNADTYSLTSSTSDPRSLAQIFTPLFSGKPLTILTQRDLQDPSRFVNLVSSGRITRVTLSPPLFDKVIDAASTNIEYRNKMRSITHWTVSGNAFTLEMGRKFFKLFTGAYASGIFLIVMYGTTELLGEATYEIFLNAGDLNTKSLQSNRDILSVGTPISNTSVSIVDNRDKNLPVGQQGEIVFTGASTLAAVGGYVGQGNGVRAKFNLNGTIKQNKKRHFIFKTGDFGRILPDKNGTLRLYVEGRVDIMKRINGRIVHLRALENNIRKTGFVKDVAIMTYHRGRESQVVIAACAMLENATLFQVNKALKSINIIEKTISPELFSVKEIARLPDGRVDKKKLRAEFRNCMLECDEIDWKILDLKSHSHQLSTVKMLCKAIALSIGLPIVDVISHFDRSYWEIGGSTLNAIMTMKICNQNGFVLSPEDFVAASGDSLSQLCERLIELDDDSSPTDWLPNDISFNGKFKYETLSQNDEDEVAWLMKDDISPITSVLNIQEILIYWRAFVHSLGSKNLCVVAKLVSNNKIVGVAINGPADETLKLPKPPRDLTYGLELLKNAHDSARYQLWRKSNGKIFQTLFMGVKESYLSLGECILVTQQLLSRTCVAAISSGFSTVLITTANPLIQEAAIHLLQFESIFESQISKFKAKDKFRPFTNADDHHLVSVLMKSISPELMDRIENCTAENSMVASQVPSVISKPSNFSTISNASIRSGGSVMSEAMKSHTKISYF